jgi:hypothetical protein
VRKASRVRDEGATVMNIKANLFILAIFLCGSTSVALACEYKAGETKFLDYANCRYGENNIQKVDLPESAAWDQCVYQVEAFRPDKLLAVTRDEDGKEILSLNDRSKIGNPCYLTKSLCDRALKAENGY